MKFFVDNNLSRQLAEGMKAFGEDVVHLREFFPEDAEDPEWLSYVGQERMYLITRDERVRRRPLELESLLKNDVGAFFLGGKNLGRCDLIRQIVRNWSRMKERAQKTRRPFAFRIPPRGTKITRIPLT